MQKAFNQDISRWNTSHVIDMYGMFDNASSFNQPIGKWNTSKVREMSYMFFHAKSFNQNINDWNVSHVEEMYYMFSHADSFNQPINKWNVSNVVFMEGMFKDAKSFSQDISKWTPYYGLNYKDMGYEPKKTPIKEDKLSSIKFKFNNPKAKLFKEINDKLKKQQKMSNLNIKNNLEK